MVVGRRRQLVKLFLHLLVWSFAIVVLVQMQKLWYHGLSDLNEDISKMSVATTTTIEPRTAPFHPFEPNQPKLLIILTYQRSGSTFFGGMFNQNPDVFYSFEPLDSFYSAFYGTPTKWNVPSDITSYKNGTQRIPPESEIKGVHDFLSALFTCNVASLPVETLFHPYLYYYKTAQYLGAANYIKCIEQYEPAAIECASLVPRESCGGRFGEASEEEMGMCHAALHDNLFPEDVKRRKELETYIACNRRLREIVGRKCLAVLDADCKRRSIRVAKTVRGTMDVAESLLRSLPNLRIIHLVRDPRAVVRSRKDFDSSGRGLYTDLNPNATLAREARIFCRTLARDVRLRLELEKKYPGRIYPIVYDDVVKDVKRYTRNAYRFLGLDDPSGQVWWSESMEALSNVDSVGKANHWQDDISYSENRKIVNECGNFFQLVDYPWL